MFIPSTTAYAMVIVGPRDRLHNPFEIVSAYCIGRDVAGVPLTAEPRSHGPVWQDEAVTVRRVGQLVAACVVLGIGVALLLSAALGSDGYSTMINGIALATGWPFVAVNCVVGVLLVAMAWVRGTKPGLGTIVQPVVVGLTISGLLAVFEPPQHLAARLVLMAAAMPVLALGVAGYLGSATGAGPTEAAALAWDPPVPFRWSYSILQGGGALLGWSLGAAVGPGTLLVIFLLGPAVDLAARRLPMLDARTPAEHSRS
jgi:uncharacterized membrane protein YczE